MTLHYSWPFLRAPFMLARIARKLFPSVRNGKADDSDECRRCDSLYVCKIFCTFVIVWIENIRRKEHVAFSKMMRHVLV